MRLDGGRRPAPDVRPAFEEHALEAVALVREVRAKQTEFRRLRTESASPERAAPSLSALVNEIRRTGNGYLRLAEAVQQAENLDARRFTTAGCLGRCLSARGHGFVWFWLSFGGVRVLHLRRERCLLDALSLDARF